MSTWDQQCLLNPLDSKDNIIEIIVCQTIVAAISKTVGDRLSNHRCSIMSSLRYAVTDIPHVRDHDRINVLCYFNINVIVRRVTPENRVFQTLVIYQDLAVSQDSDGDTLPPLAINGFKGHPHFVRCTYRESVAHDKRFPLINDRLPSCLHEHVLKRLHLSNSQFS